VLEFADDVDVDKLVATLSDNLPKDVAILSKQEFINRELDYWRENTNIGFVFTLLTIMSFLVGIILVYQILYTDVSDHWAEYATLKAIGYSNFYLLTSCVARGVVAGGIGVYSWFAGEYWLYITWQPMPLDC
jgi:putative ABC transport system permease protein